MPGQQQDRIELELTDDEAVAWALSICPEGESIHIHSATCKVDPEHLDWCDCVPQSLKKEARA